MDRRGRLVGAALLLGLSTLTLWAVFRGQDLGAVGRAVAGARPGWLLLGCALSGGYIGFEALGTWLILRALGHPTPGLRCLGFSAAGFYFSSITPSASGGQPAQVFYMARRGIPAAVGTLDMLLLTVSYQVSLVAFGLTAWAACPAAAASLGRGPAALLGYGVAVNGALTALALLFLLCPGRARRLCRLLARLGVRLRLVRDPRGAEARLELQLEEYRRGAALLRRRRRLFPLLTLAAAGQFLCLYLVPWAVYRALGLTALGPVELAATQAMVSLAVGSLPIPGAAGASEAVFLSAFRAAFGEAFTLPAMLLCRGVSFYLPLVCAGLATAGLHLRSRPAGTDRPPKSC